MSCYLLSVVFSDGVLWCCTYWKMRFSLHIHAHSVVNDFGDRNCLGIWLASRSWMLWEYRISNAVQVTDSISVFRKLSNRRVFLMLVNSWRTSLTNWDSTMYGQYRTTSGILLVSTIVLQLNCTAYDLIWLLMFFFVFDQGAIVGSMKRASFSVKCI